MPPRRPKCRLFVILARSAPVAVVFRRGPSRSVQLVRWHLTKDTFEEGQWLRGRIYERRCDLSPSGEYLLYFAAKWGTAMRTWSAISRPPWLTALALWPKGDAWGGGGMFERERRVVLNHPYGDPEPKLAPGFSLPKRFELRELGLRGRGGEDFPLYGMRLERDGWRVLSDAGRRAVRPISRAESWHRYDPPIVVRKPQPRAPRVELEMRVVGVFESGGSGDWWIVEHALVHDGEPFLELGRTDWADWDRQGDLLFAREGVLFRLSRPAEGARGEDAREILDLRERRFDARPSPASARRW